MSQNHLLHAALRHLFPIFPVPSLHHHLFTISDNSDILFPFISINTLSTKSFHSFIKWNKGRNPLEQIIPHPQSLFLLFCGNHFQMMSLHLPLPPSFYFPHSRQGDPFKTKVRTCHPSTQPSLIVGAKVSTTATRSFMT